MQKFIKGLFNFFSVIENHGMSKNSILCSCSDYFARNHIFEVFYLMKENVAIELFLINTCLFFNVN